MEEIIYKTYTRSEMLNVIKTGYVFVETSLGDYFEIALKDIPDFIMLEAKRTGHAANIEIYIPGIVNPVLTTNGCFLNKINPVLRDEIIERLSLLQTTDNKPKEVKIFDNEAFLKLSSEEHGIENGEVKDFEKLYGKYVKK